MENIILSINMVKAKKTPGRPRKNSSSSLSDSTADHQANETPWQSRNRKTNRICQSKIEKKGDKESKPDKAAVNKNIVKKEDKKLGSLNLRLSF